MWIFKLMCVFILTKSTVNAAAFNSWSTWSSSRCGGVTTRTCLTGGTESKPCKQVCYNRHQFKGSCQCSAWPMTGPCCEGCLATSIDHCKRVACGDSPDRIRCTKCDLPYQPAGFNKGCERKPCKDNNGGCSHLCTAVGGLPKCTCRVGYQLSSDEYSCIDIDECFTGTAVCEQQCVNTNGSFTCACDSGYRMNPGGFMCEDIDECGTGVSTCSQICINTYGAYHCECEKGFYLDNDSFTCIKSGVFSTKVTTRDVTTTYGSSSSVSTTQNVATLTTDYAFPNSKDGITEESRQTNSEKSPAVGVGVGVSVCILFLVGGALVMVVLKRRGILHCNWKTGNNKPSEDNVALHNYFILDNFGQSISNNAEYYNESNEANIEDDYNTIHEAEEPYELVNVDNCDYDHTTNALTSGSDTRQPDNLYNKLKIDRPSDFSHDGKHGPNVVEVSGDDYDTTSTVLTHKKDDESGYNHLRHTTYRADATGEDIKGDTEGEYDAINGAEFKVVKPDDSDYAHVNKDKIE